jgi:hypothetical protein
MNLADKYWGALPVAVRAALLMVIGCILFSITGGLIKLLGQRLDSLQIAFLRSLFEFLVILPLVLTTAPLFMILTVIFVLGEKVRWRRGSPPLPGSSGFSSSSGPTARPSTRPP